MKKLFLTFFCLMSLIFSHCWAQNHLNTVFSPPFLISEGESENYSVRPQVAINDSGSAIQVWETFGYIGNNVYVSTRSSLEGSWSTPLKLSTNDTEDVSSAPRVTMNDSGAAVVTWYTLDDSGFTNVYVATGSILEASWDPPVKVSDTVGTENTSIDPQVAMNDSGAAILTWHTIDNDV